MDAAAALAALGATANAAQIASTVQSAVIDPAPRRGRAAGGAQRQAAYLQFQKAAQDAALASAYLPVVAAVLPGLVLPLVYKPVIMRELDDSRDAVARFFQALIEIRLVGGYEVRVEAERMTALLGELMGRMPSVPRPAVQLRSVPHFKGKEAQWKQQQAAFDEAQAAFGNQQRLFTIAASRDLRFDRKPRRYWWQWWRPSGEWPGGWPGPNGLKLVEAYAAEVEGRRYAAALESGTED